MKERKKEGRIEEGREGGKGREGKERKDGRRESGVCSKFFPFSLQAPLITEC